MRPWGMGGGGWSFQEVSLSHDEMGQGTPSPCEQTHTIENITFPQTSDAGGKYLNIIPVRIDKLNIMCPDTGQNDDIFLCALKGIDS